MKSIKHLFLTALAAISVANLWAEAPAGYYSSAEGKNKSALLSALCDIVGSHTNVGYNGVWNVFKTSDVTAEGYVWDMYSTSKFVVGKKQCGNYSKVGDCYNREHSFPKSWFGDAQPMYSDAYHLYPTDGKVNGQRSNYPFGECENGTYLPSNGSVRPLGRLGKCTFPGYSGTVFEPDDQYKGDFARTYFYMAAAYNNKIANWNSDMLSHDSYPCYKSWVIDMLLKWHREDPVSQKEIDRNEAVNKHQHNRNPFIDHPELAEYIWGNRTSERWVPGGVVKPEIISPANNTSYNLGYVAVGKQVSRTITIKAEGLSSNLSVTTSSAGFSVSKSSISSTEACSEAGASFNVTFSANSAGSFNGTINISSSEVSLTLKAYATVVSGIPAQNATEVTSSGFTAHWTNISEAGTDYRFSLYESDGSTMVMGYPINVSASAQTYQVKGLQHSSDYYYTLSLTDGTLASNKIKVTTAIPVPILSFVYPESGISLTADPGKASEPMCVQVYTEYINDEIIVDVTGEFELSKDKNNWSKSIKVDAEGEYIYIRSQAIAEEGSYEGVLSAATATFQGEEVDVFVTVGNPQSFFEDFEKAKGGGYYGTKTQAADVPGTMCVWAMKDVGVWGDDNKHGKLSLRFGKNNYSSIEMAENKLNGAGTISFYAGLYKDDEDANIKVYCSNDNGTSWKMLQELSITSKDLQQYTVTANIAGAVRIKIEQYVGKRFNLDDIAITDYRVSSVNGISDDAWDIYPTNGGAIVEGADGENVIVYTLDGAEVCNVAVASGKEFIGLASGTYIVTIDNMRGKKIIVK